MPKILIVEDNFLLAEHLADIVQRDLGAEPLMATTVKEALKLAHDEVAIAFLDIELPDGKSYPIARKLMENKVPFVFVSGNPSTSLPDDLKEVPFLPKPVDPSRLIQLAEQLSKGLSKA